MVRLNRMTRLRFTSSTGCYTSIQGGSLRGRRPRAASTLSQGRALSKMRANEAGREVHDFRCKLTTCKCQELHAPGKQSWPRACTQYVERAERKSSAVFFTEIGTKKGKSFAHHTAALCCCLRSVRIIHINIGCVLS